MAKKPTYEALAKRVKELQEKAKKSDSSVDALQKCEDRFQALLNASADSAFLIDTRGTILAMNEIGALRLQKSVGELTEKNAYDLLPPQVAKRRKARATKVIQSGKGCRFQDQRNGIVFDNTVYPVIDKRGKVTQVAVYGRDITRQKQAENQLKQREATLKIRTKELEEVNSALKVLLKQRDADKTEIEEKVLFNIKELVLPYVQELEKTRLDAKQKAYLNVLQANLNSIISPFTYRLSSQYQGLTPTEIRIASLVKEGQTAKEIAEMLNVSVRTIEFHKKGIRRKLNLRNRKVNLRAHLLSMSY
jgi:PAS domain S-box-containing protein